MNFSEQFIKILDAISDKLGLAMDWTTTNIQPYLEQLSGRIVDYEIWTSALIMLLCLLSVPIFIFSIMRLRAVTILDKDSMFDDFIWMAISIISGIIMIACLSGFACESMDVITALTLPEKTILDFAMKVKKGL